MSQEQVHRNKSEQPSEASVEAKDVKNEELASSTEDILDEIDGILEENAEEFVKAYVQKGGQ